MAKALTQETWTCDRCGMVSPPVAPGTAPDGYLGDLGIATPRGYKLSELCPACLTLPLADVVKLP